MPTQQTSFRKRIPGDDISTDPEPSLTAIPRSPSEKRRHNPISHGGPKREQGMIGAVMISSPLTMDVRVREVDEGPSRATGVPGRNSSRRETRCCRMEDLGGIGQMLALRDGSVETTHDGNCRDRPNTAGVKDVQGEQAPRQQALNRETIRRRGRCQG